MKSKKLSVILFHLLLAAVPTAAILSTAFHPAHETTPDFSASAVLSGVTAEQTGALLAENFPLRNSLISLRTRIELASGRQETDGVFVLADRLIENTPAVSEKSVVRSLDRLSAFAERFDGTVSLMLVPTASSIHRDLLPDFANVASQKALIDKTYELASERIGPIDCYSALAASRDLPLYYRTDPRWTSLGAYMGYNACSNQMGFSPLAVDRFDIIHVSHNFLGDLSDRIQYSLTPDTVDIYSPPGSNTSGMMRLIYNGEEWTTSPGLYDRSADGYDIFPSAAPLTSIETGLAKAPRLLIVGDSYINALAPFLTMHYSTVTLADLLLPESELRSLIDLNSYDQILVCCTLKSFAELP